MATFLLTWNPRQFPFDGLGGMIASVRRKGSHTARWSCRNSSALTRGARVYLLRQGVDRPGIIGSGTIIGPRPELDRDWRDPNKQRYYIRVRWTCFLPVDDRLHREDLPDHRVWRSQFSGVRLPAEVAEKLGRLWAAHLGKPPEAESASWRLTRFEEGQAQVARITDYRRSREARLTCIAHYGDSCQGCGMRFEDRYGAFAAGFIHVHHRDELAAGGGRRRQVDPINKLVPLCPNCHAVMHLPGGPQEVDELRAALAGDGE